MRDHLFRRHNPGSSKFHSWCGRSGSSGSVLEEVTCPQCLRARRDHALWASANEARIAKELTERIRLLRHRAAKKTRARAARSRIIQ